MTAMTRYALPCLLGLCVFLGGCAAGGGADGTAAEAERTPDSEAAELYRDARRRLDRGDYQTAASLLTDLQTRFPFGTHFEQAQLDLMLAYFQTGEMESVILAADRYIRLHPRSEHVEYALYMRGRANEAIGLDFLSRTFRLDHRRRDSVPMRTAVQDFESLLRQFPNSRYRRDIEARIGGMRSDIAYHELHVARFYMRRDAHVAAVNRALGVIELYPDTPEADQALALLDEAYTIMNLPELRREARQLLQQRRADR